MSYDGVMMHLNQRFTLIFANYLLSRHANESNKSFTRRNPINPNMIAIIKIDALNNYNIEGFILNTTLNQT